jgi:hypothetical protein
MPTKRSEAKDHRVAKGAPADFVSWKARAAADLKRQHNVNPARMWKTCTSRAILRSGALS